ncbi:hypothetical protein [Desulfobacter postgatei]|uniref:hypothetical protein n=1 Tax=Desulfobacter postgatei TaxID=2293 RepID=UPI002A3657A4|nr:hypothetical protein [Desulfobacter postgatei]MDX9964273.1 hypothetical protein [Desulfobacter postgatei]
MMTLIEANNLVTPILRSELFKMSEELQVKADEIKKLFEDFKLTNPFGLNQFEILDDKKEEAFRELIASIQITVIRIYYAKIIYNQEKVINKFYHQ